MRSGVAKALLGLIIVSSLSCKAGPSAFDREGREEAGPGPEDTADVSTLPDIPHAPEVETLTVAEERLNALRA